LTAPGGEGSRDPRRPGTHGGRNPLQRAARRGDELQRRTPAVSFAYGVVKKYGNDNAGQLAALISYYGFLSIFPLLLVLVTVLGIVVGGSAPATHRIEHSALAQFPVIGTQLGRNIHALHRDSVYALVIGVVLLLYGSQGAAQVGQYTMAQVWNVPMVDRPGFAARTARNLLLIVTLGVFLGLSAALAGLASAASGQGLAARVGGGVVSLIVNVALYVAAFRILTPKQVRTRHLLEGAAIGGAAWTVLLLAGTFLVDRTLRGDSQVYGFFAVVLGLLAWIYLGAEATVYCAEINVVLHRHLWPRSLVPPLTTADKTVLADLVRQERGHPDQRIDVTFEDDDQPAERGTTPDTG
jgi:YihY family inner membrane protein